MSKQVVYKSKHGMSVAEGAFHLTMVVATCGLWYPVYRARKHSVDRTLTTYQPELSPASGRKRGTTQATSA